MSAVGDLIVDFLAARGAAPTANQTQTYEGSAPAPGTNVLGASQRMAGQASGTMTWTLPVSNTWAYFSMDIAAVVIGVNPLGYLSLLGVGKS